MIRQEEVNSIVETLVSAAGGLTQKQSLRGLSLRHQPRIRVIRGKQSAVLVESFEVEDYSGDIVIALFSASAVFGPKGALSLGIG